MQIVFNLRIVQCGCSVESRYFVVNVGDGPIFMKMLIFR